MQQADVKGYESRFVIANPLDDNDWVFPEYVTPRPDLPCMEWPGDQKPAPAPALPGVWRLADHKDHGRVIVTRPEPDVDGEATIIRQVPTSIDRARIDWCRPDELTYLDQEADTSDTVPESTLAVGSMWDDADALTAACEETGRDQITVTDRNGDVSVWSASAEFWHGPYPIPEYAPFTIIHAGKKDDQ